MSKSILISGPISRQIILSELEQFGKQTDAGGQSIFLGQVRADCAGMKKVKAIEYSAYKAMVNKEADKIINNIISQFEEIKLIRIYHSVGIVMAGEISMAVLVAATHRHEAIEACAKTVEYVKKGLPIWKREIFEDHSYEWKQDTLA